MSEFEEVRLSEDPLLDDVFIAYENIQMCETVENIKTIECDDTGRYLAFVEKDGTISIWERQDNKQWKRKASWKYKPTKKPVRSKSMVYATRTLPLVTAFRTEIIVRWTHGRHGSFLGVASNISKKVHLFGENSKFFNRKIMNYDDFFVITSFFNIVDSFNYRVFS